jgi:hypothetical protein
VLLAVVMAFAEGPTSAWRHSGVGAGRAGPAPDPNAVRNWLGIYQRGVVWERDGRESSVAIKEGEGTAFLVNGKSDGGALTDASTQVMSGLLGAMLHPNPKSALVIGLGTRSTAGSLGKIPTMERVDVDQPAIEEVARRCAVNKRVLENPKSTSCTRTPARCSSPAGRSTTSSSPSPPIPTAPASPASSPASSTAR